MGKSHAKPLPQEQVDELTRETKFTADEIRQYHAEFEQEFPSGQFTSVELVRRHSSLFPYSTRYSENPFRMCDSDNDGVINFRDYIIMRYDYSTILNDITGQVTLAKLVRIGNTLFPGGDATRLSEHVLRTVERDNKGVVDFSELITTCEVMIKGRVEDKLEWMFRLFDLDGDGYINGQDMLEIDTSYAALHRRQKPMPIQCNVYKIFRKRGIDIDGGLSLSEFMTSAKADPSILQALQADANRTS